MAKLHYIVRRSRSGRFNFTLLTSTGRLTGSVTVPIEDRSDSEIKQQALVQIRALAEEFAGIQEAESPSYGERSDAKTELFEASA